jgi:hypothetical protein
MPHNPNQIQLDFIEKIKGVLPPSLSLVDSLSEVLNVSTDSAYRRIRGATSLTLEEITKLCNHFNVSFDLQGTGSERGMVTFHYRTISDKEERMEEYLTDLKERLRHMTRFKDRVIVYAAEDVPVFHHFRYDELTAFKIFYWRKSLLDEQMLSNVNFDFNTINKKLVSIARETYEYYTQVPSKEIWTDATLDSTVKQLDYYFESGIVNKEDALVICKQILMMMEHIEQMAMTSVKNTKEETPYEMYYSDVMVGTNAVQVHLDGNLSTYLSFNTFNNLTTTNTTLGAEVETWLKNLVKKSSLISGVNEKQRHQIFKKIRLKAENMLKKIENTEEE